MRVNHSNDSEDLLGEPHIRIVKGKDAKGSDPYQWRTEQTIATNGMDYQEIRDLLVEYGIKMPNKPHDEM